MTLGDLARLRRPVHDGRRADRLGLLGRLDGGIDRAGADGVDPDPGRAELGGPGTGHRRQRALGRTVGGAARHADLAGHAPDVDDAAAAPGGHLRGQRRDQEVGSPDVGGEEPVEGRHVEIPGRPEPGDPGVVDQDVDRAGLLDEVLELARVAQVGGGEPGLAALGGDGVDHGPATVGVAAVHDDFGALAAQFLSRGLADARGGPRDQCAQAFKVSLSAHEFVLSVRICPPGPRTASARAGRIPVPAPGTRFPGGPGAHTTQTCHSLSGRPIGHTAAVLQRGGPPTPVHGVAICGNTG